MWDLCNYEKIDAKCGEVGFAWYAYDTKKMKKKKKMMMMIIKTKKENNNSNKKKNDLMR